MVGITSLPAAGGIGCISEQETQWAGTYEFVYTILETCTVARFDNKEAQVDLVQLPRMCCCLSG